MDQFINILLTLALVELMVAVGLSVSIDTLFVLLKNWRLLAKALLANFLGVPAITMGLLYLFGPHPLVSVGFLILAVCPGAPYGPPFTAIAKGNVPAAVGLMVVLVVCSAILAPLSLQYLLPQLSASESVSVDATKLVTTLLVTQLLPLAVGLAARHFFPKAAIKLLPAANLISKILNLLAITLIVVVHFRMLAEIRLIGFAGMLALLTASIALGWLLGGPGNDNRKAMALTTSLRNAGLSLMIASANFAGTPVLTAVLAYALVEVFGSLLLALWWSRTKKQNTETQS